MAIFHYGDVEITYLKKRDKALGAAIDTIGPIQREVNPDLFSALVNSMKLKAGYDLGIQTV